MRQALEAELQRRGIAARIDVTTNIKGESVFMVTGPANVVTLIPGPEMTPEQFANLVCDSLQ